MKKALITGITGQDGYYLSKLLIDKGYEVHGTIRRSSSINTERLDSLIAKHSKDKKLNLHYSDLTDSTSLTMLIKSIEPDEIYNLAAQSHVAVSFKTPMFSSVTSSIGTTSLLEAVRNSEKEVKFYQASSSEMYGGSSKDKLNESSAFDPKSPYAVGKVFAHDMNRVYRESFNLFCVNGILFNHESPHRGETFVTRKITRAVGRIHLGLQEKLTLGNLDASRDWGFAGDYVYGMWLMMQHDTPEDWVLATGKSYTVKEFLQEAFTAVNLNWEDYVVSSEEYFRPNEVDYLLGDSSKAQNKLGWENKTSFNELVKLMVDSDIDLAKQEKVLLSNNLISPTWEHPKN
tara:strand:+ start:14935 stop:15969 length:1035 start_codon:yes stop_codon:yes gene_type:complete